MKKDSRPAKTQAEKSDRAASAAYRRMFYPDARPTLRKDRTSWLRLWTAFR